jgi:hypothetical protein
MASRNRDHSLQFTRIESILVEAYAFLLTHFLDYHIPALAALITSN